MGYKMEVKWVASTIMKTIRDQSPGRGLMKKCYSLQILECNLGKMEQGLGQTTIYLLRMEAGQESDQMY